jgi:hypothetical protein
MTDMNAVYGEIQAAHPDIEWTMDGRVGRTTDRRLLRDARSWLLGRGFTLLDAELPGGVCQLNMHDASNFATHITLFYFPADESARMPFAVLVNGRLMEVYRGESARQDAYDSLPALRQQDPNAGVRVVPWP